MPEANPIDRNSIHLEAELRADNRRLYVEYTVENRGAADIVVLDHMYRTRRSGERVLDPRKLYVVLEADGTAHLTRSMIPIPPGLKVEYPEVPYGRILKPGESVRQTAIAALPLRPSHPYDDVVPPRAPVVRRVRFTLGVMPRMRDLKLKELRDVAPGVHEVMFEDADAYQILIDGPTHAITPDGALGERRLDLDIRAD